MEATKYKDSGIPWIGEIPSDWEVNKINQLFSIIGSGTTPKATNDSNFVGKINWIQLGDINGGFIVDCKNKIAEQVLSQYSALKLYKQPFIIVAMYGASVGNISISKIDGCVNQACCVMGKSNQCFEFLFYAIKSAKDYLIYRAEGGGQPNISQDKLKNLRIPLPPLPIQQRIADFLDRKCAEIDELAALQETMIEELKRYKQSLITETVTKGLNKNAKMKDSGVEWIGEIPERWEVKRLKFVANRRNEKADDTKLKYIGLEHIVGFSKEMVETENVYDNEGANMCYARDVIFGKLRPYLGKAKVIEDACCCSSEFIVLCNVHCPDYLRYLLLSGWFIEIVNASTYGTKMPRANADFIMNMLIPVPHTNEQQQIADYLDRKCAEIDELIVIKQQKIEALKEYKKSVIFEYVTGKKEVV